eukprot:scaffold7375_cov268-Pinguiococcus_pyrenoidosus.AAC.3
MPPIDLTCGPIRLSNGALDATPVPHGIVRPLRLQHPVGPPVPNGPADPKEQIREAAHERRALVLSPEAARDEASQMCRVARTVILSIHSTHDVAAVEQCAEQAEEQQAEDVVRQRRQETRARHLPPVEEEVPEVHAQQAKAVAGRAQHGAVRISPADGERASQNGQYSHQRDPRRAMHCVQRHSQQHLHDGVANEMAVADVAQRVREVSPDLRTLVPIAADLVNALSVAARDGAVAHVHDLHEQEVGPHRRLGVAHEVLQKDGPVHEQPDLQQHEQQRAVGAVQLLLLYAQAVDGNPLGHDGIAPFVVDASKPHFLPHGGNGGLPSLAGHEALDVGDDLCLGRAGRRDVRSDGRRRTGAAVDPSVSLSQVSVAPKWGPTRSCLRLYLAGGLGRNGSGRGVAVQNGVLVPVVLHVAVSSALFHQRANPCALLHVVDLHERPGDWRLVAVVGVLFILASWQVKRVKGLVRSGRTRQASTRKRPTSGGVPWKSADRLSKPPWTASAGGGWSQASRGGADWQEPSAGRLLGCVLQRAWPRPWPRRWGTLWRPRCLDCASLCVKSAPHARSTRFCLCFASLAGRGHCPSQRRTRGPLDVHAVSKGDKTPRKIPQPARFLPPAEQTRLSYAHAAEMTFKQPCGAQSATTPFHDKGVEGRGSLSRVRAAAALQRNATLDRSLPRPIAARRTIWIPGPDGNPCEARWASPRGSGRSGSRVVELEVHPLANADFKYV